MRQIKIGDSVETVVERADFPPERLKAILGKETVAVLGYGVQGRGQSLNLKDNGVSVIVGLRDTGRGWDLAQQDGWVPGKTLFALAEAAQRGTIIPYLLSDAGQKEQWPHLKPYLTAGKALYFSHGFSIVYKDQTDAAKGKALAYLWKWFVTRGQAQGKDLKYAPLPAPVQAYALAQLKKVTASGRPILR